MSNPTIHVCKTSNVLTASMISQNALTVCWPFFLCTELQILFCIKAGGWELSQFSQRKTKTPYTVGFQPEYPYMPERCAAFFFDYLHIILFMMQNLKSSLLEPDTPLL